MDAIFNRVSVREYKEDKINEELIKKLLTAGMSAPSAGNEKPWFFVVIDNKDILNKLSETSPYSKMVKNAPLSIVVCVDKSKNIFEEEYWVMDCAAATENILVEATANGLGSVWLAVCPAEDRMNYVRDVLKMEGDTVPFAILPIGFPIKHKEVPNRYDDARVYYNKWKGGKNL